VEGTSWVALDPLADRTQHAHTLRRIHADFQAGLDVTYRMREVVARSWRRSGEAGIDPGSHCAPIVLAPEAVEDRWERHPLHRVLPVLRDLLSDATRDSNHMLVLSDAGGVLLWMEGHRPVIEATEDMHFVRGADWSEAGAGTNALGTALAVDHPVQIFSAEHFTSNAHPWQCSGAPIHDPETGGILGVIDLTGHFKTGHPHTLALVAAAANMAEAQLRQELVERRANLRELYRGRVAGATEPTALVTANGTVLEGAWLGERVGAPPPEGGELVLADGSTLVVEPLAEGACVLWRRRPGGAAATPAPGAVAAPAAAAGLGAAATPSAPAPGAAAAAAGLGAPAALRFELLRSRPRALVAGREVELGRRQAELLAVLALSPAGLTAEQLALELYGEAGKPVSVRAEIVRIKRLLGPVIGARPYRLIADFDADFVEAEHRVDRGDLAAAVALHSEPLLRDSEVPAVAEARTVLEFGLRRAVMASLDPALLDAWCRTTSGRDDAGAAERLLELVGDDDPLAPRARARVERLRAL
jgi:hypothetical protein